MKKYIQPLLWIIGLEMLAFASGFITRYSINHWYTRLDKSALTPPNVWFPTVWSTLYAMIAVAGYLIWQVEKNSPHTRLRSLFFLQLAVNLSWTPLFFYFHHISLSLLVILVLIVLVFLLIIGLLKKSRVAALLLTPYLLWLGFAAYLNTYIWIHN